MWSGEGPASCLDCPALLVLEIRSTGNESTVTLPQGGPIYLPPHLHQLTRPWPWPQGPSSPSKARFWPLPLVSLSSKIHSQNLSHALPKLQPCPGTPQPLVPGAWPDLGPASRVPEKTLFLSPCFVDCPLHTCYLLVLLPPWIPGREKTIRNCGGRGAFIDSSRAKDPGVHV